MHGKRLLRRDLRMEGVYMTEISECALVMQRLVRAGFFRGSWN